MRWIKDHICSILCAWLAWKSKHKSIQCSLSWNKVSTCWQCQNLIHEPPEQRANMEKNISGGFGAGVVSLIVFPWLCFPLFPFLVCLFYKLKINEGRERESHYHSRISVAGTEGRNKHSSLFGTCLSPHNSAIMSMLTAGWLFHLAGTELEENCLCSLLWSIQAVGLVSEWTGPCFPSHVLKTIGQAL